MHLLRKWRVKNRHEGIALESGERSLFFPDGLTHDLEIAVDQIHHLFWRALFAEAGIATNIGEENRDLFRFTTEIERHRILNQLLDDIRMNVALEDTTDRPDSRLCASEICAVVDDKCH